jgi:hypothetical protein
MGTEYDTTPPRVARGVLTGASLFAALIALPFLPMGLFVFAFVFAFFSFGAVFLVIAAPLWILFHALHWRSPKAAASLGFSATFVTCAIVGGFNSAGVLAGTVLGIIGAGVGLIIWGVAYREIVPQSQTEQQGPFFE